MKATSAAVVLAMVGAAVALQVVQNPCAGCTEDQALRYQQCAHDYGDPCQEVSEKEIFKLDYLGQKICEGREEGSKDGKCKVLDATTGKECPENWRGEKDWEADVEYDFAPKYEKEKVTVKAEGEGKKKDVRCCMVKEKHAACLKCNSMDCSFGTCDEFVNQKYYHERALEEAPLDDKAAMKEAGWGLLQEKLIDDQSKIAYDAKQLR